MTATLKQSRTISNVSFGEHQQSLKAGNEVSIGRDLYFSRCLHIADDSAAKAGVPRLQTYSLLSRRRVTNFVGRQEQLEEIESFFLRRWKIKASQAHILILHALGGQGKSQIALEYCQQSTRTYRGIFWIPASSKSLASQAYDAIARKLEVSPDVAQVKETLASWEQRCLLVFDNYDTPDEFQDVLDYVPLGTLF